MVRHSIDAQLPAEKPPLSTRPLLNSVLQILPVSRRIRLLHLLQVDAIPVEAHQPRDEQLAAQAVLLGRREGVVEEQGVAGGLVDNAIKDVGDEFTLPSGVSKTTTFEQRIPREDEDLPPSWCSFSENPWQNSTRKPLNRPSSPPSNADRFVGSQLKL